MLYDQERPFGQRKIRSNGSPWPYFDTVVWADVATLGDPPSTAVLVGRYDNGLPCGPQVVGP